MTADAVAPGWRARFGDAARWAPGASAQTGWLLRGVAHAWTPEGVHELFAMCGYDAERGVADAQGFGVAIRRALFACDDDGVPLRSVTNPCTDRTVVARPLWLDALHERHDRCRVVHDGAVLCSSSVALPHPLSPHRWTAEWCGPTVASHEARTQHRDGAHEAVSITRTESWWPWLAMGDRAGHVVVQLTATRCVDAASLPVALRAVLAERPEFCYPPQAGPSASPDTVWDAHAREALPLPLRLE